MPITLTSIILSGGNCEWLFGFCFSSRNIR